MPQRILLLACLFCSWLCAAEKPNLIVILVDDMGYSDLSCYGSEIPTPNLDALAANGLKFTQFYNTARCCPTRAALLTGLYSHQAGVGHMVEDKGEPGYRGRLNDKCATMAEILKTGGYFTAMTGKWHVGYNHGVSAANRGFDRSLIAAAGGFYYPESPRAQGQLVLNGEEIKPTDPRLPPNWYSTDLWTTFGMKFIDEANDAKKPFFLYLAYNAPHFPLQAPADEIEKFRAKYKEGWDTLRRERHERQMASGLIDKEWGMSARPQSIKAWKEVPDDRQERFEHLMATYAACVAHMDKEVGVLVEHLKKTNQLDNTLILFMSDNGGNAEGGPAGITDGDPTKATSDWHCGESWAFLENTPFRRYKHFTHEGGISTPLIAHWPAGIEAKGESRDQVGHVIDIFPTLLEVSGTTYPKDFNGHAILPLEGKSLVPAFTNKPVERNALYWEHEGNAAVRVDDMKLVRFSRLGEWELYDMKTDRTEQKNLAGQKPTIVKKMAAMWDDWAKRANVIPYPNETKKGKKKGEKEMVDDKKDD